MFFLLYHELVGFCDFFRMFILPNKKLHDYVKLFTTLGNFKEFRNLTDHDC